MGQNNGFFGLFVGNFGQDRSTFDDEVVEGLCQWLEVSFVRQDVVEDVYSCCKYYFAVARVKRKCAEVDHWGEVVGAQSEVLAGLGLVDVGKHLERNQMVV